VPGTAPLCTALTRTPCRGNRPGGHNRLGRAAGRNWPRGWRRYSFRVCGETSIVGQAPWQSRVLVPTQAVEPFGSLRVAISSAQLYFMSPIHLMTAEITPLRNSGSRKRLRAGLCALSLLVVINASIWFNREALLRYAADQWIVSDNIHAADAVVVLGGGIDTRPFAAAEDYRKGLTRKILVANVRLSGAEALGVLPSHTEINRGVLIKLGVPEANIETFGTEISTTYEEAHALRDWAIRTHARSIIVPIEVFPSRRVRWVLARALAGTGTEIQVQTLGHAGDWWKSHYGQIAFQGEVIKYLYYRYWY
jgi:DUF218 domain